MLVTVPAPPKKTKSEKKEKRQKTPDFRWEAWPEIPPLRISFARNLILALVYVR